MTILRIAAAGSLRRALGTLLDEFSAEHHCVIEREFGPAGLLRQRIEQGRDCDLFASANCAHPQALVTQGKVRRTALFTRNRLCLVMHPRVAGQQRDWLDALLDPRFVLATSTPGSDPSGDYTLQLFDLIDQTHPGAGSLLRQRARHLVGGPQSAPLPPGVIAADYLIQTGQADIFIGYAHYTTQLENADLQVITLPAPYQVVADYQLAVMKNAPPLVDLLVEVLLSPSGQQHLIDQGFIPVASLR